MCAHLQSSTVHLQVGDWRCAHMFYQEEKTQSVKGEYKHYQSTPHTQIYIFIYITFFTCKVQT